jgi:Dolichyl-phosphate-mannose-protein mannosyltransferase
MRGFLQEHNMLRTFFSRSYFAEHFGLEISVLLAFLAKLILSLTTIGTNDSATWYGFLSYISQHDGISLYHHIDLFNHPPFMIHVLQVMGFLTSFTGISFYFWLRLPAILTDIGSVVIVARLLKLYLGPRFSRSTLVLLALSPASVMISGFHGNTDPLMIFFILLAIYSLDQKSNVWLAGIAFGMSMNIKVTPIIFLPALLLYLPSNNKRLLFLMLTGATFVICGLPYTVQDPLFIGMRLFGYSSNYGDWGISRLLVLLSTNLDGFQSLNLAYTQLGKWIMLAFIIGESIWMNRSLQKPPLFLQFGLIAFTFMAITPGFGVQYFAWLVPWVSISIEMALFYYTASGLFLFFVYTAWSREIPWFFAISFKLTGSLMYIEILCWVSVVIVLIMYFKLTKSYIIGTADNVK